MCIFISFLMYVHEKCSQTQMLLSSFSNTWPKTLPKFAIAGLNTLYSLLCVHMWAWNSCDETSLGPKWQSLQNVCTVFTHAPSWLSISCTKLKNLKKERMSFRTSSFDCHGAFQAFFLNMQFSHASFNSSLPKCAYIKLLGMSKTRKSSLTAKSLKKNTWKRSTTSLQSNIKFLLKTLNSVIHRNIGMGMGSKYSTIHLLS